MKQGRLYDGRGLILGHNSPCKNIPIREKKIYTLKKIIYTKKKDIDEIDGNDRHIYHLKKIDEIQEILTAERNKRNELSIKYNRGVNIIGVIDNCLGVNAIGLGMTGVGLLSTSAVIGIEAVSIVMGLLRLVGNQAIKKLSLKIEKHEKIAMLAVSSLNTISSLISKALSDDSISDEEYLLILLEFETFTRMKEDLREKSKMSMEKLVT